MIFFFFFSGKAKQKHKMMSWRDNKGGNDMFTDE